MKGKKAFIPSFLTGAVIFSLLFSTFVVIWGMLQAGDGVDSAAIVDSALRVFGTELGICGVMTDYEEKFHNMGTPINRCVGTKLFRAALSLAPEPEEDTETD